MEVNAGLAALPAALNPAVEVLCGAVKGRRGGLRTAGLQGKHQPRPSDHALHHPALGIVTQGFACEPGCWQNRLGK